MISSLSVVLALTLIPARTPGRIQAPDQANTQPVHHELSAQLGPAGHRLRVRDQLSLPGDLQTEKGVTLRLHAGLELSCADEDWVLTQEGEGLGRTGHGEAGRGGVAVHSYRLQPRDGAWPEDGRVQLIYQGQIHHPLEQEEEEAARSFSRSPGLIDAEGVVLSGSTYWVPVIDERLLTFELTVSFDAEDDALAGAPDPGATSRAAPWQSVSQGTRTLHEYAEHSIQSTWECAEPMEEMYLIAARFHESTRAAGATTAHAFLREEDPALASRYLEATAQYLDMYQRLLGPYPYGKFALVENFWETGYGMPSFTLLGSNVIRLPFILHSSYPHEILHNWWGNSVFVDWESGNWCEGLTAYLADHLIKEGQGRGEEYRRDTLNKYQAYVQEGRDFPLVEFRSRHSPATEAVGYGKALMLFHMLRRKVGDESFARGLGQFYRQNKFRRASFQDLARSLSDAADEDLLPFVEHWITRPGAPHLRLSDCSTQSTDVGYRTVVQLSQVQEESPYLLPIPIAFTLEGQDQCVVHTLDMAARDVEFEVLLPARPLRVEVDPQFDLFRRLDQAEIPASLAQLFGAPEVTVVLPQQDSIAREAWHEMAASWFTGQEEGVSWVGEEDLEQLPEGRAIWLLGANNRFAEGLQEKLSRHSSGLVRGEARFGAEAVPQADHCFVYVSRRSQEPQRAIGWIGADSLAALPGLARKLPHYGKYSYLAFAGSEPTNVVKGQWSAVGSPLVRTLADAEPLTRAQLPPREPLASLEPVFDPERLMAHVERLASPEWQGRGVGSNGLDQAAEYVADQFRQAGLEPGGLDGSFFQSWQEADGPEGSEVTLRNVIGVLPGRDPARAQESVVIGAHYDHLGLGWPDARQGSEGKIHPGADDNASGVAVLLEVAALLGGQAQPERSLVFVAFSGEEWGLKGSRHYVQSAERWPLDRCLAMVNLDMVGNLRGAKLMVLGSGSASEWKHIAMGVGFTTGVESVCVADDFGSSDQRAFLDAGVPAVQLFTGPTEHHHRPSDTPESVDADGLVEVATFLRESVVYLGDRPEPLSSSLREGAAEPAPAASAGRRVSLGTMPDFAFPGPGVKVASVLEDSPASRAGLLSGDLLLALDGQELADLRAYSEALKAHAPGDSVTLLVQRGEEQLALEATLVAR